MQSTVATEPDFVNSKLNLLACLALYQHRQDQAIGIGWMSSRVRGMLWYYNWLQHKQMTSLLQASYLNGIIQQGAAEIKMWTARAKKAKDKRKILEQVQEIQTIVEKASNELKEIEQQQVRL